MINNKYIPRKRISHTMENKLVSILNKIYNRATSIYTFLFATKKHLLKSVWQYKCHILIITLLMLNTAKGAKAQSEYILPASLITYGVLSQYISTLDDFDYSIRDNFLKINEQKTKVDDYIQYLPALAFAGLGSLGVESKYNFTDRLYIGLIGYTITGSIVLPTKLLTNVTRPDMSADNSFPSGHTAVSFVGADLIYMTYKDSSPIYGIAAYACASSVAFMRMYNNRHWFSDVVCGAGVGILASRLSFWIYDRLKQNLINRKNDSKVLITSISPFIFEDKVGLSLNLSFGNF